MSNWKPRFKINQIVCAFDTKSEDIYEGRIVEIHSDRTYKIRVGGTYIDSYINVRENYIARNIKQMVKNILGKDYIYTVVLEEYLSKHFKEMNKDE